MFDFMFDIILETCETKYDFILNFEYSKGVLY